jgi:hypothetical protein
MAVMGQEWQEVVQEEVLPVRRHGGSIYGNNRAGQVTKIEVNT